MNKTTFRFIFKIGLIPKSFYMDKDALKDLQSNNRLILKALYNQYRAEFQGFGRRYNQGQDSLGQIIKT